jgi:hypothetical protein
MESQNIIMGNSWNNRWVVVLDSNSEGLVALIESVCVLEREYLGSNVRIAERDCALELVER